MSIPDDLWDEARERFPGFESPSALVQEALRTAIADSRSRPAYAQPATDTATAAAIEEVRKRLSDDARDNYQTGYRQGVEFASRLSWEQLSWLESLAFDLRRAAEDLREGGSYWDSELTPKFLGLREAGLAIGIDVLARYLGKYADDDPASDASTWAPDDVVIEGMEQALQDMWVAVRETRPSSPPEVPGVGEVREADD